MTMSKWKAIIEYGPIAADSHIMVVDAASVDEAEQKAIQWAQDNYKYYPMITITSIELPEDDIPMDDDFTSEIEWTSEEEEEFLMILNKSEKDKNEGT